MILAYWPRLVVFFVFLGASETAQQEGKYAITLLGDTSKEQIPVHQASAILAKLSRLESTLEVYREQLNMLLSGQTELETMITNGFAMLNVTFAETRECLNCPQLKCPEGYYIYESKKYGEFCYRYESNKCKSWSDARRTCQNEGGDLMIPDEFTYQFFRNLAERKEGKCQHFWIGGYTDTPGYNYVTVKGVTIDRSFPYWSGNQPDGVGGESCLEMRSYFNNYLMNDFLCNVEQGFICQIFS